MKLSKDQKNMLKGLAFAFAVVFVGSIIFVILGRRTWNNIWPTLLGSLIGSVAVYLFLIIGSRVPEKKDEDKE